jgi:ATP-dependent Clp protease ATP-binding subunit ClpX
LDFNLQEAYGDDWEDKIDIPEIQETEIRCSFCGKGEKEVIQIIAGPTVYICNECIAICNEIITQKKK